LRKALVVGCARNVWDDVRSAQALCEFDAVYCVKQSGIYWPHEFDVWVTLHPEFMDAYEAERAGRGLSGGYEIVSPLDDLVGAHAGKGKNIKRKTDYRFPGMNASASSGIFAVKVALVDDGFDRVVLAGVPFDANAGHFLPSTRNVNNEVRGKIWKQKENFEPGFKLALPFMRGKVRSMSGYTAEVLGTPDRAWLSGETP
jgi:hypothetical protein